MKKIAVAIVLTLATTSAYADSCKATSAEKNSPALRRRAS